MKIFRTVKEMQEFALRLKQEGRRIGLVPTMGALHEGHLTLMRAAKEATDFVIASVFVNPTQFGPNEDFDAYPRRFEEDCRKLESVGVDAVFHPQAADMYPQGFCTYVNVDGDITHKLCGAQRPIHFRGVATVVTKLFNITQADEAFFGQKDAQQVVVVCRFVQDLNLPVHINMVPIVREESGLARSSRNVYLSPEEKTAALVLSRSLRLAKDAYEKGERNAAVLKALVTKEIAGEPLAAIDYVDLFSFPALEAIETVDEKSLLALAVRIGKTRLIDNIILG
ncbi:MULTISPECIES: pantoate--beta-alanine ligase [Dialister]|uniref:pantoate--beta-alanine ligase n=1 Tax=Dialister TaxID=39948 RepID=UPI0003362F72|nr:pantoate--beta-alanine ligase [Dialister massiliensis]UYJ17614.1 MAG: pantoate--beta-alanine ligase [Veillonellaceae bacterium]CDD80379.1 pantothenate synthetase [Dialister sp. CAG:357]HJI41848.1 pantoate--beta-alanine ligase [Veillonellaceae bacterium]